MSTTRVIPAVQSSVPLPSLDVYYLTDPRICGGAIVFPGHEGPYHRWLGDEHPERQQFVLDIPSDFPCFAEGLTLIKSCLWDSQAPKKNIGNKEEAMLEYREWERTFPTEILFRLYDPLVHTEWKLLMLSDAYFKESRCKTSIAHKLTDMDAEDKALLSPALKEKHMRLLAFWGLLARATHRVKCSGCEVWECLF